MRNQPRKQTAWKSLLILGLILPLMSYGGEKNENSSQWHLKMKRLSELLPQLLKDTATPQQLYVPDTQKRIKKNAKELSKLAHEVSLMSKFKDRQTNALSDPGVEFLAAHLDEEAALANEAIANNQWAYGREVLKKVAGYCISCHTRNFSGPEFSTFNEEVSRLDPFTQAELAAATRQFDSALEQFLKILGDKKMVKEQPFDWWRAAKFALAISVRFKQDPDSALKVVNKLLEHKRPPLSLTRNIRMWKTSILKWKKEKTKSGKSETALFRQAENLLSDANKMKSFPADHAADVLYLRATASIHELLQQHPKTKRAPEALYLAGQAYETLNYPGIWSLHENYFERCIRKAPHTKLAGSCYERLEGSLYYGYSGSGGTNLPAKVKKKLNELKGLSQRKKG